MVWITNHYDTDYIISYSIILLVYITRRNQWHMRHSIILHVTCYYMLSASKGYIGIVTKYILTAGTKLLLVVLFIVFNHTGFVFITLSHWSFIFARGGGGKMLAVF